MVESPVDSTLPDRQSAVFLFGDAPMSKTDRRPTIARDEMGFEVVRPWLLQPVKFRPNDIRALARNSASSPLITDDYLEVEE